MKNLNVYEIDYTVKRYQELCELENGTSREVYRPSQGTSLRRARNFKEAIKDFNRYVASKLKRDVEASDNFHLPKSHPILIRKIRKLNS